METHPVALPPTIALAPGSAFWASPLGAIWPPWWPQRRTCRDLPFRCWSTPRRMWKLEEKFRAGRSEEGHNLYWLVVTGTFGLFFHILGTIIPTDFHIFQRGRYTTNQNSFTRSLLYKNHDKFHSPATRHAVRPSPTFHRRPPIDQRSLSETPTRAGKMESRFRASGSLQLIPSQSHLLSVRGSIVI